MPAPRAPSTSPLLSPLRPRTSGRCPLPTKPCTPSPCPPRSRTPKPCPPSSPPRTRPPRPRLPGRRPPWSSPGLRLTVAAPRPRAPCPSTPGSSPLSPAAPRPWPPRSRRNPRLTLPPLCAPTWRDTAARPLCPRSPVARSSGPCSPREGMWLVMRSVSSGKTRSVSSGKRSVSALNSCQALSPGLKQCSGKICLKKS